LDGLFKPLHLACSQRIEYRRCVVKNALSFFGDCAQPPLARFGLGGRSDWAHSGYLEQRAAYSNRRYALRWLSPGMSCQEQPLGGTGMISLQKTNPERRSVLFSTVSH
jgi:hypothetical protein